MKRHTAPTLVAAVLAVAGSSPATSAMEFSIQSWRGHKVVQAQGEIVVGDTNRLLAALHSVDPLPHGSRVILLDSPGGSVAEALRMSDALDVMPAHTVIPDGARCASACASILFIAGALRTVENGGLFGQHSCAIEGKPNQECNNLIAQHAVENGVSYGSIDAFVTYVAPESILWFSREEVDCWGISRYPFSEESGFENFEPCAFRALGISEGFPAAQSAWRVDFHDDGYRAFLRPSADHDRELELSLFCDESIPGQLFLSMDIGGDRNAIKSALIEATLMAVPAYHGKLEFHVEQVDTTYSRVIVDIPRSRTVQFLRGVNAMSLKLSVARPYVPIVAHTYLSNSREALIFAANHCINTS